MTDQKVIDQRKQKRFQEVQQLNKTHPLCLEAAKWLSKTPWGAGVSESLHPTALIRWAASEAGLRDSRVDDVAISITNMESRMSPGALLVQMMQAEEDADNESLLINLAQAKTPEEAAATIWESATA